MISAGSHLDCLTACKTEGSGRFILIKSHSCYCATDAEFRKIHGRSVLRSDVVCFQKCSDDDNGRCGGVDIFSVYVTGKKHLYYKI